MARYFFTVRDGDRVVPDPVGSEHADLEEAQFEARMTARDLLFDRLKTCDVIDGQEIDITDDGGVVLSTLRVRDVMTY